MKKIIYMIKQNRINMCEGERERARGENIIVNCIVSASQP